ncbi:MAG: 2-hydroxychromene-2-carboxylate isomerase [Methylobacteriaceae bacterium]|nr:2-hydroxychromene-2-carboxylate isomerase [Methylobacteriaceae bacterium]
MTTDSPKPAATAQARPVLDFWFEFASTYSYLAAMRAEALADEHGVALRWRPFLLGPIFAAQGWSSSPFNLYPAKGRNMWRDMERQADELGLPPLARPVPFPQNGLLAARIAIVALDSGWGPDFVRAVYEAQFARGLSIAEPAVLREILGALPCDPEAVLVQAGSEPVKTALREQTEEAIAHGIFGAPSFLTADGELFWGNDRFERAVAWAARRR